MLFGQDPQRMNDIAQIDSLTQRIITFHTQQQEFFDAVAAQLTTDRDRAREASNKDSGQNYRGGCGFDSYPSPHISSNEEDGGYDGPPIFDKEYDSTISTVDYKKLPQFNEKDEDPILEIGYEKTLQFEENCEYDGPPIFDEENSGYDDTPIFDKEIEDIDSETGSGTGLSSLLDNDSIESHKYYLAPMTMLEMLTNRGFAMPSCESEVLLEEFDNKYGEMHEVDELRLSTVHKDGYLIENRKTNHALKLNIEFPNPKVVTEYVYARGYLSALWECEGTSHVSAISCGGVHKFQTGCDVSSRPLRAPPWIDNSFIYDLPSD